jgi:hypothetical protein
MDESTARALILERLSGRARQNVFGYTSYGYDLYIPSVIFDHVTQGRHDADRREAEKAISRESPVFMSAAWRLCLENILRPGVKTDREQVTEHGSGGMGYSLTEHGKDWIKNGGT